MNVQANELQNVANLVPNLLVPVSGLSLYEYFFAVEAIRIFQEYWNMPVDDREYYSSDGASFIIGAAPLVKDHEADFISLGFESKIVKLLPRTANRWKESIKEAYLGQCSDKMNRLYELFDDLTGYSEDNLSCSKYAKRLRACCAEIDPILISVEGRDIL
jgi:hypothetical protein